MPERVQTHLVGSLPFADAGLAMQESLQRLGETLPYLPDGETGERANYIMHLVDRLARNPALSSREVTGRLGGLTVTSEWGGCQQIVKSAEFNASRFKQWRTP